MFKNLLIRYLQSTMVYNGLNLPKETKSIIEILNPKKADLVILLDLDPKIAVERKKKKGDKEIYDRDLEFLEKVRSRYLEIMKECYLSKKWVKIDASNPLEKVIEQTKTIIKKQMNI